MTGFGNSAMARMPGPNSVFQHRGHLLAGGRQAVEIGASAETAPRAGQDGDANMISGRDFLERINDADTHLVRERIQSIGAIQCDDRDPTALFV